MDLETTRELATEVLDAVDGVVVGKRSATEVVLAGILAGGHVLMEDYPGLGKTLAARTFAQALGLDFARAQFTPDLLPADLTGSFVYDQGTSSFEFRRGPVFTGLLLADEINRTPPKTQSALLEAMQERQVTVEGQTFPLERPFHVLATANPVEYEGTYPLPEAQLDRFLVRVAFGYPTQLEEWEVLRRRMTRRREEQSIPRVVDAEGLMAMQDAIEDVAVDPEVGRYCVSLVTATREHEQVLLGASPRGSLALLLVGRALRGDQGPGLPRPGRRQGRGRGGPGAPGHGPPGAVDERGHLRERRQRPPAHRPDAAHGVRRPVTGSWRPTPSLSRAVVVGLAAAVYAVVAGDGALAVVALPLVAAGVWAALTRPTRRPSISMQVPTPVSAVGSRLRWQIDVDATPGLRDLVAILPTDPDIASTPEHGHVAAAAVRGARTVAVAVEGRLERWGPRRLGPAQVAAFGDLQAWMWQPETTLGCRVAALPEPDTFSSGAPLPHPVGLVGSHRSARPGEGSELADIRPFQTGDRLRRIHWPVSLRTGTLHVTTTYADHDTEVRILLDASTDARGPAKERGSRGSVDLGVAVAGAIAAHYLRAGDRVGLNVHAAAIREVPALGGRQHLHRLLAALALTEPGVGTVRRVRTLRARMARGLRPGAVVIVLSPILERDLLGHAIHLSRTGHHVIVIDTLPAALLEPEPAPELLAALAPKLPADTARLAWRMRLAERAAEERRCESAGVPVVRWVGPGSLDAVLRALGRRGRAPSAVSR